MHDDHAARHRRIDSGDTVTRFEAVIARAVRHWIGRKPAETHRSRSGQPWILAVSGGADSMSMLHAVRRRFPGQRLIVAHMNHHAREGSDADEAFVHEAVANLGLDFEAGHWRPVRASHFEADARRARHEWLAEVAANARAAAVMTAHTLDDQVETVLMRLARGAGPWGLAGIRPSRTLPGGVADLVRPMLPLSRGDVLAYVESLGIPFREDPTNADVENQSRAWIRHVVVPQFTDRLNVRFRDAIGNFADLQAEEQEGLERLVRRRAGKLGIARFEAGVLSISLAGYRSFGPAWLRRRLLRTLWSEHGLPQRSMSHDRWVEIDRYIRSSIESGESACFPLPGRMKLEITSGEAAFAKFSRDAGGEPPEDRPGGSPSVAMPCPGHVEVESMRIVAETVVDVPTFSQMRRIAGHCAALDAAALRPPLVLRKPVPGDRFDPLGLGGKHQKLTDYLRIRGIKGQSKAAAWIVEDRAGIVWVVGQGVSERAKVQATTARVCMIRVEHVNDTKGTS